MDWNLVQSFLAVADAGTLMQAAENLGISQPTLGRHITDLEQSIGLTLFIRGRGGMTLTEAGLSLVEDARAMAGASSRIRLKGAGQETVIKGTVRLTCSEVVATYLLPPLLADLAHEEPDIQVELVASNQVVNLLMRDADIAIRMVRPTQADLITRKVNEMRMGTYASTSYLTHHPAPQIAEDLWSHRLIGYDRNDFIISQMKRLGFDANRQLFDVRTDHQVVYWELVKSGAGIGFGPKYVARNTPDIVELLPDLKLPPLPMWLTSHQELKTSARIRRVMDFLSEALSALPLR